MLGRVQFNFDQLDHQLKIAVPKRVDGQDVAEFSNFKLDASGLLSNHMKVQSPKFQLFQIIQTAWI